MADVCTRRAGQGPRHSQGFAREVSARLGYTDPQHQAGDLFQEVTEVTATVTDDRTDKQHSEDEMFAQMDRELAVTLPDVTGDDGLDLAQKM